MPVAVDQLQLSGDESRSDNDSLTMPMQRKRGRPVTTGQSKVGIPKKPVVPRGRGRPAKGKRKVLVIVATGKGRGRPKGVTKKNAPKDVENGYCSAEDGNDEPKPYNSPTKGRGRPKKA